MASRLASLFSETRKRTLSIVKNLEPDDYMVQTAFYVSPPKWHMGHVSWMYEMALSKVRPGYVPASGMGGYLNSYYNQFGRQHDKGTRGSVSRPTLREILSYFDSVTKSVSLILGRDDLSADECAMLEMAINHECQHQELLVFDLQHILADLYRPPHAGSPPAPGSAQPSMVGVPGGLYELGHSGTGFCYDNEMPSHEVFLQDYSISKYPVTNGEYMKFVEAGGYGNYEYWLSDGWDRVRQNGWDSPMYWERVDGKWHTRDFAGLRELNPREPVVHVSYYEADAYCRWAGMRLPTEAEWEKAACWNPSTDTRTAYPWGDSPPAPDRCNVLESHLWRCSETGSYPGGASHVGCHQMIGDVWEWTSSEYVGYPGFRSGFREYNDKWFTGQKVLRGGSFGFSGSAIRSTYRNFFRLDERWMYAGLRCAA